MADLREYLWDAYECMAHEGRFEVPEGKPVEVTDPCYDRSVWCRTEVELPPGIYTPFINKNGGRVAASGIVREDLFGDPEALYFKPAGDVGVDAGLMGFFIDKPDYSRDEWLRLCDAMREVYEKTGEYPEEWETPEGFFTESGWGDGGYPVYLITDAKGIPVGVMVVYIDCYTDVDDEEEEEEEEEEE